MARARPPHNLLTANAIAALVSLAKTGTCVVMTSDQRVHIPATRLYTYPDAVVAWGERLYTTDDPPSLLNPHLIVEVTSDSTEEYDRGTKFLHYQAISSLREYLVVSHREKRLDHHRRLDSGQWLLTKVADENGIIELPTLGASILLADVYAKVDFQEGRPA